MRKFTSVVSVLALLALLRSEPVYAVDLLLFNATTGDAVSVPKVVQVGGDAVCDLKIDSGGVSEVIVTIYHAASVDAAGDLVNPAVWYQAINPTNGDPDHYLVGTCPNFVGGVMTDWVSGEITVRLRSRK